MTQDGMRFPSVNLNRSLESSVQAAFPSMLPVVGLHLYEANTVVFVRRYNLPCGKVPPIEDDGALVETIIPEKAAAAGFVPETSVYQ
jgi:hypothetical protein